MPDVDAICPMCRGGVEQDGSCEVQADGTHRHVFPRRVYSWSGEEEVVVTIRDSVPVTYLS